MEDIVVQGDKRVQSVMSEIKISLGPLVTIPLSIDGVLPIGLSSLGPLLYPIELRGEPAYLGLGGRECRPV